MIPQFRQPVAMLLTMLCGTVISCSRQESSLVKAAHPGSLSVAPVVSISRGSVTNSVTMTAEFQPFQEIDVMAKVAGYVRTIKVDLGDRVREGQLLAELEVPEMKDEIAKADAAIDQSGAEISAARDDLQRAESSHQIIHLAYTRVQAVSEREPGLVPQHDLDDVRSRDLVAEAQIATAKSRLRVEEQKSRVAKAEGTRLQTMRNYITITAPFAGTVTKRYANPGAMIQAGIASQSQAMPLVHLSQLSTLRLSLPVPESLVPLVRIGRPVEVKVQSLAKTFEGRVARFASRIDPSTRTMITEVDVNNPTGVIVPGMYARVELEVKRQQNVLTAPLEAVERTGTATRMYLVDQSGMVRIVPVELGIEDAHKVEIISGVEEGQQVITGRKAGLNAGDRVSPQLAEITQ